MPTPRPTDGDLFQSTPLSIERSDNVTVEGVLAFVRVSIHAPLHREERLLHVAASTNR